MIKDYKIMDGNEAAAYIAYKTNEICAIYPITPSSAMGEHCDEWSSEGKENIYGQIPEVIEMQSEAGAAGAVHGALQAGALATTFTSSQGLLLMIPNMYKIAGELTPAVFHIAARTLATHALSIFGDHSDVMSVRQTGWAMLFGNNAQEAMDLAMISQAATFKSRIPFLNIFDGFRTSHELMKVELVPDGAIREMMDMDSVDAHRNRALSPDNPIIRGTAQNPDVFFQSREAINSYYAELPAIVQDAMDRFAELTGRKYSLFEYYGHPEPEKLIVIMGSGAETVEETVEYLSSNGEKVGFIKVRLFRSFSVESFLNSIPASVTKIAVLDRCKEPGSIGDPLYMDVVNAFNEREVRNKPQIFAGRYGLASKEFTPAMVKAIFDEMGKAIPKNHFTIGINDDVSHTSLDYDETFSLERQHLFRGLFYGLGADGTVSANKNSIKIIGDCTDNYVQGYFVYDSKKSGSLTVSHLRFGKNPIHSTYLVSSANFVACHHFTFLSKYQVLKNAEENAVFLLNSPYDKEQTWRLLPSHVQDEIVEKKLQFYVVNASGVARETGMGSRINTILQTCFFAISGILPRETAIERIKDAIRETYSAKGEKIILKNFEAVDKTLENLQKVDYGQYTSGGKELEESAHANAPGFVQNVLAKIMYFEGNELPVSAFPIDGTYPTATTQYEKRNIADTAPVWDKDLCSQCGKCFLICPHAAIRSKVYDKSLLKNAPDSFSHTNPIGKEFQKDQEAYTLQVSVEDCTGCRICVEYCPVESKTEKGHKAINMQEVSSFKVAEKNNWDFFLSLPEIDRDRINVGSVKGSQLLQPLFEFSGACSGCGETPYVKLISQLFGDKMIVANATGCSSIYGGNLPTTPWTVNAEGKGPAWANSLFEDNAEFGLGIKLAADKRRETAISMLNSMRKDVGETFVNEAMEVFKTRDTKAQRRLIAQLKEKLEKNPSSDAKRLLMYADDLCEKVIWLMGGDGWAYDIGFGGLDHVLSSGKDVNILVMDTEVYSNTGGQKSKATPFGASAKFSIDGKKTGKKDLAMQAMAHGSAYVAQVALGANDVHAVKTILEAEAFPGPSLVIAYSHCIAHGYDMAYGAEQQQLSVKTGYWPLFRFNPLKPAGERFMLDSKQPSVQLKDFLSKESRFNLMLNGNGNGMLGHAESEIAARWEKLNALKNL